MTQLFILQNQDKLFLSKKNEWSDGRDLAGLYRTPNKDEAVNQLFEASSKDYSQRIQLLTCAVNDKGLPDIDPAIMPEPLPKQLDLAADAEVDSDPSEEELAPSNNISADEESVAEQDECQLKSEDSATLDADEKSAEDDPESGNFVGELTVRQA